MIHDSADASAIDLQGLRYLVVGAGLFGATIAERIATDKKVRVVVLEKRNHIGGNSYSETDPDTGIEYHRYGSHIFHTRSEKAWQYINRFGSFNSYRHRVFSCHNGMLYPMPINLATINSFYGMNLTPQQARQWLHAEIERDRVGLAGNLEEKAVSLMGRPLYEAFVKGYTQKQWGLDPVQLPPETIARLPIRFSYKTDYFDDPWQGIPMDGYGKLVGRMLSNENIEVHRGIDFFDVRQLVPRDCRIIFTGPIDRFFDYKHGKLKWRSMRFEKEVYPVGDYQGTAVINFPDTAIEYVRIHEYRHYHEERSYPSDRTLLHREYPLDDFSGDDPFYPVNTDADRILYALYLQEQKKAPNVIFGGRLGSYAYLNMDQSILSALQTYEEIIQP